MIKNNRIKTIIFVAIGMYISLFPIVAQTNNDEENNKVMLLENPVPASPTAASLGQYANEPISTYTGIPDISIPLYEIKTSGFSMPVSLSYHAGGIKVADEASCVGLGWSLNAGGCITRQIRGTDDLATNYGFPFGIGLPAENDQVAMHNYFFYQTYFLGNGEDPEVSYIQTTLYNDPEPDLFSYNFGGYSGRFILNKGNNVILLEPESNVQIKYLSQQQTWIATLPNGVVYYFNNYELTESINQSSDNAYSGGSWSLPYTSNPYISSWFVSKIELPNKTDICFEYTQRSSQSIPHQNAKKTIPGIGTIAFGKYYGAADPDAFQLPVEEYTQTYSKTLTELSLSKISWNQGTISFVTSNRLDMQLSSGKIDKMIITDTTHTFSMGYVFKYSYFNNQYINSTSSDIYYYMRLKLMEVAQFSNNDTLPSYKFYYDESHNLPSKDSPNTDHWGYYNGQTNAAFTQRGIDVEPYLGEDDGYATNWYTQTYPNLGQLNSSFALSNNYIEKANKEPDSLCAKTAMLTKITYPTGGSVTYTYEPNTYYPNEYQYKDTGMVIRAANYTTSALKADTIYFTIYKPQVISYTLSSMMRGTGLSPSTYPTQYNTLMRITDASGATVKTESYAGSIKDSIYTAKVYLLQGSYRLIASPYQQFQVTGNISFSVPSTQMLLQKAGGGVRIAKITNGAVEKKFLYQESRLVSNQLQTVSSGLLLTHPSYEYIALKTNMTKYVGYATLYVVQESQSNVPVTSFKSGTAVGYDRVEEDISDGTNKSRIVRTYYNQVDTPTYPFSSNLSDMGNGLPLTEEYYQNNLLMYKKTFQRTLISKDTVNAFVFMNGIYGYYNNISRWWQPTSVNTTEFFYENNLLQDSLTTFTQYGYNGNNFLPNRIYTGNSNGQNIDKRLFYSTDFPYINAYYGMIGEHDVENPVQVNTFSGADVNSNLITYKRIALSQDSISVPDKIYKTIQQSLVQTFPSFNGSNATTIYGNMPEKEFVNYDITGNIREEKDRSGLSTTYLWGYNYEYPVAKIEGLTYSQVLTYYPQTSIDNLASAANPTIDQINAIRTALSSQPALVTTYTYAPLIGMTSETNPQGVTTNYTYDTFGRLWLTRNDDKNFLSRYRYGYQNAPATGEGGYTTPSAVISVSASSYTLGATGSATASASGGSGGYTYNWYLETSSGAVLSSSLNTTSTSFSFTCSQTGTLTVQCVVTDNQTGQTATVKQTLSCYSAVSTSLSAGPTIYLLNSTCNVTATTTGGSGSFTYNWYLNNSSGTVLQSSLNSTSTQFAALCSQTGSLTLKCVASDNITGQSGTGTKSISCYSVPIATLPSMILMIKINTSGTATVTVTGGSGSFIYNWSLINSSGTVLQSSLNSSSSQFTFSSSQIGNMTLRCTVQDKLTGVISTTTESVVISAS
jgi:hypothetical protein